MLELEHLLPPAGTARSSRLSGFSGVGEALRMEHAAPFASFMQESGHRGHGADRPHGMPRELPSLNACRAWLVDRFVARPPIGKGG